MGKIAPFRGQGKGAWPICKRHYAARSPLSFPAFGDLFLCTLFHFSIGFFYIFADYQDLSSSTQDFSDFFIEDGKLTN